MEESWDFKNHRVYRETAGGPADGTVYGSRGIWRGFGNASGSSGSRDHQPDHSDYYGCFAANSFSGPPCLGILAVLLLVPGGFCALCLRRVDRTSPMAAIRRESGEAQDVGAGIFRHKLRAEGLSFHLALRQVLTGRKRYTSACLVAALLVFFASLAGRMNGWGRTEKG